MTSAVAHQLSNQHIADLTAIAGQDCVLTDKEMLLANSKDHTEDLQFVPEVVINATSVEAISKVLAYCNQHKISVTTRGAGTGLSGGALPIRGGVILNTAKLNQILEIDEANLQCTVECGVINQVLQDAVIEKGLFYPPDPASKGSCFIGGNIAHSSGGPRALKYGTTRDYVLNLEVVLADGSVIWTGANTLKYSSGYNLTHLMIGSEGTLGVVTKAVLKLIPHPSKNILMLASFESAEQACIVVNKIFLAGCTPSVCEFVEPEAFKLSSTYTGLQFEVPNNVGAYLLIEVDGFTDEEVMQQCEKMYAVLEHNQTMEVLLADSDAKKEYFWKLRRTIGESTKHNNVYKEEDTVVPRAFLPQLFKGVKQICAEYKLRSICYGHAGDGNLHVNILKDNHTDDYWQNETKDAIRKIFALVVQLKGTISGEHGIGIVQKEYLPIALSKQNLALMKHIKAAFDPNNILNPEKIF